MTPTHQEVIAESPLIWTDERVFVSPAFGCPARCAFCYLPEVNVDKPRTASISPEQLAELLRSNPRFKMGSAGTVLSLGCLSEPLAPHSIKFTLRFLEALGGLKNPIQIATRWAPNVDEQTLLIGLLEGLQSAIFHSMIEWGERHFEIGTPDQQERSRFIDAVTRANVPSVLYLKPFIAGHTPKFTSRFIELAARYRIRQSVIGPFFLGTELAKRKDSILQRSVQMNGFLQEEFPVGPTPVQPSLGQDPIAIPAITEVVTSFLNHGIAVHNHSLDAIREIYGRHY